jgi:hypothetical protein
MTDLPGFSGHATFDRVMVQSQDRVLQTDAELKAASPINFNDF